VSAAARLAAGSGAARGGKFAARPGACYSRPMIRLALKLALAAAALWAMWTFVPVRGRTLADRWRAAGNARTFVERARDEIAGRGRSPARPQARSPRSGDPRERPSEGHNESDRAAVERLLSDRLSR
jgi:hypothetical protein